MKRTMWGWVCGLLAMLVAMSAAAAEVDAFVEPASVPLGQSVTLNIRVKGDASVAKPDLQALVPDFVIGGTSRSSSVRINNASVSRSVLFAVSLKPRRVGTLTIPSLTVDGEQTAPLTVTVLPAGKQPAGAAGRAVFIRTRLEPESVYVGQQAHLRVRLYFASRHIRGKLQDPHAGSADVTQLGKQQQSRERVAGTSYRVVQRDYAIVAHKSGSLEIPPVSFQGSLLSGGGGFGSMGGFFGNPQQAHAQSAPLTLDVRPRPDPASTGPWLPARSLTLRMTGLPADGKAQVGTPFTLTMTETASGIADAALPDPALPAIDGAEVYPDKTEARTDASGRWLQASRQRKFVVVPTRAGSLHIPSVAVDWWDVGKDQAATSSVPAHTIEVAAPAPGSGSAAAPQAGTEPAGGVSASAPANAASRPAPASAPTASAAPTSATPGWRCLALAFGLLWLVTLLAWAVVWLRRRRRARDATREAPQRKPVEARRAFRQAADSDTQARTLLAWARAERPGIHSLGGLATRLDDHRQRDVLGRLDAARFAAGDRPAVEEVRSAFAKGFAWHNDSPPDAPVLPPLYPPQE